MTINVLVLEQDGPTGKAGDYGLFQILSEKYEASHAGETPCPQGGNHNWKTTYGVTYCTKCKTTA